MWSLNPTTIDKKMRPSKRYKSIEVEVEEIIKDIMEERGISYGELNAT